MITTLGLFISGFAVLAILLNAIPLYVRGRLPTEREHGASVLCVIFMFLCTAILFGVLL